MTPLQAILDRLKLESVEGCTGLRLDCLAEELTRQMGFKPAFLGYNGFPNSLCVSINKELIHGVPDDRKFQNGDIVKLDFGLENAEGEFDDGATTIIVGGNDYGSRAAQRLIKATEEALEEGCAVAKAGYTTNDIAFAIQRVAKQYKLFIAEGFGGHGIGKQLHMPPLVPNVAVMEPAELKPGMRIAIEPMFGTKSAQTILSSNKWTIELKSGLAAHFERTVTIQ